MLIVKLLMKKYFKITFFLFMLLTLFGCVGLNNANEQTKRYSIPISKIAFELPLRFSDQELVNYERAYYESSISRSSNTSNFDKKYAKIKFDQELYKIIDNIRKNGINKKIIFYSDAERSIIIADINKILETINLPKNIEEKMSLKEKLNSHEFIGSVLLLPTDEAARILRLKLMYEWSLYIEKHRGLEEVRVKY